MKKIFKNKHTNKYFNFDKYFESVPDPDVPDSDIQVQRIRYLMEDVNHVENATPYDEYEVSFESCWISDFEKNYEIISYDKEMRKYKLQQIENERTDINM